MKKLTGPAILAAILMTHVGLLVATEEAYTFRSNEYIPREETATPVTFTSLPAEEDNLQTAALSAKHPLKSEF